MITRQTTLILGAGASAPFGFPTGYGLLKKVLQLTFDENTAFPQGMAYFESLNLRAELVSDFNKQLRKSGKQSVDAFLEHRPEFIPVGKAAIALVLIHYENEKQLFLREGEHWYEYLYNQLNAKWDDFERNKLSILTFNYDRSLEHYLLTCLQNSYKMPISKCVEKLQSIPIIHLHGDLGGLTDFDQSFGMFRNYDTEISANNVRIASERIKIIHEGFDNAPQFEHATKLLAKSEVICFLGFGFHQLTMKRLGFDTIDKMRKYKADTFGTTFGLTNAECNRISNQYKFRLREGDLSYHTMDVLAFLRERGILFGL